MLTGIGLLRPIPVFGCEN